MRARRTRAAAIGVGLAVAAASCDAVLGIVEYPADADVSGQRSGDAVAPDEATVEEPEGSACVAPCSINASCDGKLCGCAAGGTLCDGGCISATADPENCGSCGASCRGSCLSGRCLIILAYVSRQTAGIAVNASSVFWLEDDGIWKVPLEGGDGGLVVRVSAETFTIDANAIYWTQLDNGEVGAGEVDHATLDGGLLTPIAGGEMLPFGITTNADGVYWTNASASGSVKGSRFGAIVGLSPDVLASGQQNPLHIAADDAAIYWTDFGLEDDSGVTDGTVMKLRLDGDGGAPQVLAAAQPEPEWIAIDHANVYWANSRDGTVMKAPLSGGTASTLAQAPTPLGVVSDGENLYWASVDAGTILRVPVDGGTVTTLATGQEDITGVAVDKDSVYWLTSASPSMTDSVGAVVKLTPK